MFKNESFQMEVKVLGLAANEPFAREHGPISGAPGLPRPGR